MNKIQAIRGMNDLLPAQTPLWQYLEATIAEVLSTYGYQEIRFPVLEQTELFKRSIGEVTDIVEKEMYTFPDRNGDSLSLRPEGTACCVRACEEHGLLYNQTQRLWYAGPMFRHERPQKGRLRQFHQIGVEAFGMSGPDIDVELLMITRDIWRALELSDFVELQINTLGSADSRARYREALVAYLVRYREDLDEDSLRRLSTNPLRILDTKNERTREILQDAPVLDDFLEQDVKEHFTHFCSMLDVLGIGYVVNPHLVRGLDYYNNTVFEWVTTHLGAQGTVCAGGRYDGLVSQLGGKHTPAIGCAMGLERMVLLLEAADNIPPFVNSLLDVYMVVTDDVTNEAFLLANQLREAMPGMRMLVNCGGGNIKSQMKRADKSGAQIAVILGVDEIAASTATVKFLRDDKPQQHIRFELLEDFMRASL